MDSIIKTCYYICLTNALLNLPNHKIYGDCYLCRCLFSDRIRCRVNGERCYGGGHGQVIAEIMEQFFSDHGTQVVKWRPKWKRWNEVHEVSTSPTADDQESMRSESLCQCGYIRTRLMLSMLMVLLALWDTVIMQPTQNAYLAEAIVVSSSWEVHDANTVIGITACS